MPGCPICGKELTCDMVDIGVGEIQSGPYGCDNCHWVQEEPGAQWETIGALKAANARLEAEKKKSDEMWRENLLQSAAELRMVREALEQYTQVKSPEECLQPGQEGEALVVAVIRLAGEIKLLKDQNSASADFCRQYQAEVKDYREALTIIFAQVEDYQTADEQAVKQFASLALSRHAAQGEKEVKP